MHTAVEITMLHTYQQCNAMQWASRLELSGPAESATRQLYWGCARLQPLHLSQMSLVLVLTCKWHCRSSVPSGRVGGSKDALFQSNERFREAVRSQEDADVAVLEVRRWKRHRMLEADEAWLFSAVAVPKSAVQARLLGNVRTKLGFCLRQEALPMLCAHGR